MGVRPSGPQVASTPAQLWPGGAAHPSGPANVPLHDDPVYRCCLLLSGWIIAAKENFERSFPFLVSLLLGFSLSLSWIGSWLPSPYEPLTAYSTLLDERFNISVVNFHRECVPDPDLSSIPSQNYSWFEAWFFPPNPSPVCVAIDQCWPWISHQLLPSLLPSALAVQNIGPVRVASLQAWISFKWHVLLESLHVYAADLRTYAVSTASTNAVPLLLLYAFFPGKTILSGIRLLMKYSRTRTAQPPQHQYSPQ